MTTSRVRSEIEVLAPGNEVFVGIGDDWIPARVTHVTLYANSVVRYGVAWWSSRERREDEVAIEELRRIGAHTERIGYWSAATPAAKTSEH